MEEQVRFAHVVLQMSVEQGVAQLFKNDSHFMVIPHPMTNETVHVGIVCSACDLHRKKEDSRYWLDMLFSCNIDIQTHTSKCLRIIFGQTYTKQYITIMLSISCNIL